MQNEVTNVLRLTNLVRENVRTKQLFTPYNPILVTLSGGQDSICSILLLFLLQNQLGLEFRVRTTPVLSAVAAAHRSAKIRASELEHALEHGLGVCPIEPYGRVSRASDTPLGPSVWLAPLAHGLGVCLIEPFGRLTWAHLIEDKLLERRLCRPQITDLRSVSRGRAQVTDLRSVRPAGEQAIDRAKPADGSIGKKTQKTFKTAVNFDLRPIGPDQTLFDFEKNARLNWLRSNLKVLTGRSELLLSGVAAQHRRYAPRPSWPNVLSYAEQVKRGQILPHWPARRALFWLPRQSRPNWLRSNQIVASQPIGKFGVLWCNHFWQKESFHTMLHVAKVNLCFSSTMCFYLPIESVLCEQNAREWRHKSIQRTCAFFHYECCTQGHTKSDRVETILFNILRGTGIAGLQALQWKKSFYSFSCQRFYPCLSYYKLNWPHSTAPLLKFTQGLYKIGDFSKPCLVNLRAESTFRLPTRCSYRPCRRLEFSTAPLAGFARPQALPIEDRLLGLAHGLPIEDRLLGVLYENPKSIALRAQSGKPRVLTRANPKCALNRANPESSLTLRAQSGKPRVLTRPTGECARALTRLLVFQPSKKREFVKPGHKLRFCLAGAVEQSVGEQAPKGLSDEPRRLPIEQVLFVRETGRRRGLASRIAERSSCSCLALGSVAAKLCRNYVPAKPSGLSKKLSTDPKGLEHYWLLRALLLNWS